MGDKIVILKDDREKKGWTKNHLGHGFSIKKKRLKTGDYTIKGMEKILCVERKSGWDELAYNLSLKVNRINIEAELERMLEFKLRYLIITDDFASLPPSFRYSEKFNPLQIPNWILKVQMKYDIHVLTIGRRNGKVGKHIIRELFRNLHDLHKTGNLIYKST